MPDFSPFGTPGAISPPSVEIGPSDLNDFGGNFGSGLGFRASSHEISVISGLSVDFPVFDRVGFASDGIEIEVFVGLYVWFRLISCMSAFFALSSCFNLCRPRCACGW